MRKSWYTQIENEIARHPLEQGVFCDARKTTIAVVGIGSEAGASFVAANLAYHLAKHVDGVCYVEAEDAESAKQLEGRRQAFYAFGLDRKWKKKGKDNRKRFGGFTDYYALEKEGLPAGNRRNLYENVNWAVCAPAVSAFESFSSADSEASMHTHASRIALSESCMLSGAQGIERIPGRYMIVDNPKLGFLRETDLIICVVDPLPSRIRSGIHLLEALRDNRIRIGRRISPLLNLPTPVLWVLNKDNSQVSHRELEHFLKIRFDFVLPLLSPEIFYRAEYSGIPIFKISEAGDARAELDRLTKQILQLLV